MAGRTRLRPIPIYEEHTCILCEGPVTLVVAGNSIAMVDRTSVGSGFVPHRCRGHAEALAPMVSARPAKGEGVGHAV